MAGGGDPSSRTVRIRVATAAYNASEFWRSRARGRSWSSSWRVALGPTSAASKAASRSKRRSSMALSTLQASRNRESRPCRVFVRLLCKPPAVGRSLSAAVRSTGTGVVRRDARRSQARTAPAQISTSATQISTNSRSPNIRLPKGFWSHPAGDSNWAGRPRTAPR